MSGLSRAAHEDGEGEHDEGEGHDGAKDDAEGTNAFLAELTAKLSSGGVDVAVWVGHVVFHVVID